MREAAFPVLSGCVLGVGVGVVVRRAAVPAIALSAVIVIGVRVRDPGMAVMTMGMLVMAVAVRRAVVMGANCVVKGNVKCWKRLEPTEPQEAGDDGAALG